jgi:hypothetical protein
MLRGLIDIYKKSSAAVVARTFLEQTAKEGFSNLPSADTAASLVEVVWEAEPKLFNGHYGQRPFKLTVAAAAFAQGIRNSRYDLHEKFSFAVCLGKILHIFQREGNRFPLNGIDHELLGRANRVYSTFSEEVSDTPLAKEISELMDKAKEREPQ